MSRVVGLRADGGPEIGYGHLVRTGALAETLLGHDYGVACLTTTPEAAASVYPDGTELVALDPADDPEALLNWVDAEGPEAVLIDSYEFDTAYQCALDEVAPRLAVILDDTRYSVCADVLINGNVYAPDLEYDYRGEEPEWCLGLDYLLLREAIRTRATQHPPWRDPPERALVTMGGSDIRGTTPEVLPAFEGTGLVVDVVIGPGFRGSTEREIERVAAATDADIRLSRDPPDLAEKLFEADLAVSATGSTSYELLALGTPTIGIPQAHNQVPIAEALAEHGAMVHLSSARTTYLAAAVETLRTDAERRRSLRERGRELVDGHGTERVYRTLAEVSEVSG